MTTQTAAEIGRANAETAIDQKADHRDLKDALQSYYENAMDTLAEVGTTTERAFSEMTDAFKAVMAAHHIDMPGLF